MMNRESIGSKLDSMFEELGELEAVTPEHHPRSPPSALTTLCLHTIFFV
jgi:hypothetical protein